MRIDHSLPGDANRYHTPPQKEQLFISPSQWDGRRMESHSAERFERMNNKVEKRRQKLMELGAEDAFGELFMCINEAQDKGNDVSQDEVDWKNVFQSDMERFNRGEIDLSAYMRADEVLPNAETVKTE